MRSFGQVKSGFWIHHKVKGVLNDAEKLLYVYLVSCEHSNALGCYRLPVAYVSDDLDWSFEKASETLSKLFEKGFIQVCERSSHVLIRDFLEHQPVTNPNIGRHCLKIIESLPKSFSLKTQLIDELEKSAFLSDCVETLSKAFDKDCDQISQPFRTPEPKPEPKPINNRVDKSTAPCIADLSDSMVETWNEVCGHALRRAQRLTTQRRVKLRRRLKEDFGDDLDEWRSFCGRVCASPFLAGDNDRQWQATLDWVLEPRNLAKILDGNFDPRKPPPPPPEFSAEQWRRRAQWYREGWPPEVVATGRVGPGPRQWPPDLGVPPGQPGSFMPVEIQTEFGFAEKNGPPH